MFDGLPEPLLARFLRLPMLKAEPDEHFEPDFEILKEALDELRSNVWQRKPTVTSLELRLRELLSQSALAKSDRIVDTLRKHSPHLPFADIYQCCLLVFGKSHPITVFLHHERGIFHFNDACTLLLDMELTAENVHAAVYHLTQAGEADFPTAFLALAELYEHGLGSIIAIDPVEDVKWSARFSMYIDKGRRYVRKPDDEMAKSVVQQARERAFSMQLASLQLALD